VHNQAVTRRIEQSVKFFLLENFHPDFTRISPGFHRAFIHASISLFLGIPRKNLTYSPIKASAICVHKSNYERNRKTNTTGERENLSRRKTNLGAATRQPTDPFQLARVWKDPQRKNRPAEFISLAEC
jgi:hypothetical protein